MHDTWKTASGMLASALVAFLLFYFTLGLNVAKKDDLKDLKDIKDTSVQMTRLEDDIDLLKMNIDAVVENLKVIDMRLERIEKKVHLPVTNVYLSTPKQLAFVPSLKHRYILTKDLKKPDVVLPRREFTSDWIPCSGFGPVSCGTE